MSDSVRVRFAPSPTGFPHIGNIRTALFNWLFARRHGGKFIVRVEDTDQGRLVPGAVEQLLDTLRWLNLQWDEGPVVGGPHAPYFQSERLDIYHGLSQRLLDQGQAYRCYCTEQRLAELRERQQQAKQPLGYDRQCRRLSLDEQHNLEAQGGPSVIRFAMPASGITAVDDLIRGEVAWQNSLLDDFVIIKSDGYPTYHMAVVADDHLMQITHVLRAEEWLPSTPRHLQLHQALDIPPPRFAHLPMILGPDRAKLSKRHGATAALEYRDNGFMPETMTNFLAVLGWSLDDKTEIMAAEMLVENFSLERVSKSAAIFDQEKLAWMNGVYIRQLSAKEFADRAMPFLERDLPPELLPVDRGYLLRILPLVQERTKLLSEIAWLTSYFFQTHLDYDGGSLVQKGMDRAAALTVLATAEEQLGGEPAFRHAALEESLRAAAARVGLSPRQFFGTLRVAATGREVSPPLFETMEVLGPERVLSRLRAAMELLDGGQQGE